MSATATREPIEGFDSSDPTSEKMAAACTISSVPPPHDSEGNICVAIMPRWDAEDCDAMALMYDELAASVVTIQHHRIEMEHHIDRVKREEHKMLTLLRTMARMDSDRSEP